MGSSGLKAGLALAVLALAGGLYFVRSSAEVSAEMPVVTVYATPT